MTSRQKRNKRKNANARTPTQTTSTLRPQSPAMSALLPGLKETINSLLDLVLPIQSCSRDWMDMRSFIVRFCESHGWRVSSDRTGNTYVRKGDSHTFPCAVAHIDTVHPRIAEDAFLSLLRSPDGNNVCGFCFDSMLPVGIGGDDKCGIVCALAMLSHLPYAKAAFFVDEEIGCVGSSHADVPWFSDCRFLLQADRRGNNDFVTSIGGSSISSARFQSDVRPLAAARGYSFRSGGLTDVKALRDIGIALSAANLSAGYYRPHTENEYIHIPSLLNCADLMCAIAFSLSDRYPTARRATMPIGTHAHRHNRDEVALSMATLRSFGYSSDEVETIYRNRGLNGLVDEVNDNLDGSLLSQ